MQKMLHKTWIWGNIIEKLHDFQLWSLFRPIWNAQLCYLWISGDALLMYYCTCYRTSSCTGKSVLDQAPTLAARFHQSDIYEGWVLIFIMRFGFSISLTFSGCSVLPIDDSHLNKSDYSSCCLYASGLFSALYHNDIATISALVWAKWHQKPPAFSVFLNPTQLLQRT